jgi:hypothetical protein
MGDAAEQEPFGQIAERLLKELIEEGCEDEAPESITTAYLDYVIKRERIRRDATDAGQRQDAVDHETLETLKNAQLGDPKFVEAEAIFRRLGTDPVLALRYYEQLIIRKAEDLSKKQSKRARNTRSGGRTKLSQMIDEIVLNKPNISENELRFELLDHNGIQKIDGELRDINNSETIKDKALKDYLYRAKKRNSRYPG